MLNIKSILAGACFTLSSLFATSQTILQVTLKYEGRPLCFWNVTVGMGDAVWKQGVTDKNGFVSFDVPAVRDGFDLRGVKATSSGEKKWEIKDFLQYDKSVDFGDMNGTYENTNATLNFETAIRAIKIPPTSVEVSWGLTLADNDCGGSENNAKQSDDNFTKDIKELRELQKDFSAERKIELEQQKIALDQKIQRLNQRIAKARDERMEQVSGSAEYSNKSYDLRDFEIELEIAELELDRNLDEQATRGNLPKADRQRYNDKIKALQDEQKLLVKNRKDGLMYGQAKPTASEATTVETPKEKEVEKPDYVIYSAEELANMSSFDLKRTQLSYKTNISRRELTLKTNASLLEVDRKAQIKEEIVILEKQIETIKAILAQRKEN